MITKQVSCPKNLLSDSPTVESLWGGLLKHTFTVYKEGGSCSLSTIKVLLKAADPGGRALASISAL